MEKVITINFFLNKKKIKKLITIGIAFSFQKYKKIPTTKSDIKLNYILTEKRNFLILMNILILGDVMGPSGVKAIKKNLPDIIKKKKIDFVVLNGENAGDKGVGITKKIFEEFLSVGVDVITTGNHVWDEKEAIEFISKNIRLLRPANLIEGSPGNGMGIYKAKNKKK